MSFAARQMSLLTRQLGSLFTTSSSTQYYGRRSAPHINLTLRSMANAKSLKAKRKAASAAANPPSKKTEDEASLQHKEWVKFQQSIAVEGFETGQTVAVKSTKKTRGGKTTRRQTRALELEEEVAERQRLMGAGGGLYPPLRYSDEETEQLLTQAYAAIPEKAGKRGTRNLKRQGRRWHLVRKIHKKYKYHMALHQERKMAKRSQKMKDVKEALAQAPDLRQRDRAYQAQALQRWATAMVLDQGKDSTFLEEGDSSETQSI